MGIFYFFPYAQDGDLAGGGAGQIGGTTFPIFKRLAMSCAANGILPPAPEERKKAHGAMGTSVHSDHLAMLGGGTGLLHRQRVLTLRGWWGPHLRLLHSSRRGRRGGCYSAGITVHSNEGVMEKSRMARLP